MRKFRQVRLACVGRKGAAVRALCKAAIMLFDIEYKESFDEHILLEIAFYCFAEVSRLSKHAIT